MYYETRLVRRFVSAREGMARLWKKACIFDGIPAADVDSGKAHFVVFSKGNPWERRYDTCYRAALRLRAELAIRQVDLANRVL